MVGFVLLQVNCYVTSCKIEIILTRARCGGDLRVVAVVTEPHAVRRLPGSLGLAAEPPPRPVAAVVAVP